MATILRAPDAPMISTDLFIFSWPFAPFLYFFKPQFDKDATLPSAWKTVAPAWKQMLPGRFAASGDYETRLNILFFFFCTPIAIRAEIPRACRTFVLFRCLRQFSFGHVYPIWSFWLFESLEIDVICSTVMLISIDARRNCTLDTRNYFLLKGGILALLICRCCWRVLLDKHQICNVVF